MKSIQCVLVASVVMALASCTHETVYYRTPSTRTVYRTSGPSSTIPGQAYRMPNPEEPTSFRAQGAGSN